MGVGWWMWRWLVPIALVMVFGSGLHREARAQGAGDLKALEAQIALLLREGKTSEAIPIAERYTILARQRYGEANVQLSEAFESLARVYSNRGRHGEAERLLRESLSIREKVQGPGHSSIGVVANDLAGELYEQRRFDEAEPLFKRALSIVEMERGLDHPHVAIVINNLGRLYSMQHRWTEAEPMLKRALAVFEKSRGPDHANVAVSLSTLASVYLAQNRYIDAEPLYRRALAIAEKSGGPDASEVATALDDLARLFYAQRRDAEAEPLYKRALVIYEQTLGPDHPYVAVSLSNRATLYHDEGRPTEARPLFERALAIFERSFGPENTAVANSLSNLGWLHFDERNWARAADDWRRSIAIVARHTERGTNEIGRALTGKGRGEFDQDRTAVLGLIKTAHRISGQNSGRENNLAFETFQVAQRALGSQAASSLAQMAARGARGDPVLAARVRERQDLVEEWQKRDGLRSAIVAQGPDQRDRAAETANVARVAFIDKRIAEIDTRLAADFPDYAALSRPTPLAVEEAQAQLGGNEALVLFLDTDDRFRRTAPEETFIWVVTKTDMRWVRSDLGTPALTREVAALRCGLDAALWDDEVASAKCSDLVKAVPQRDAGGNVRAETLPFDTARAHALYKALFGQVEDLIAGKHLLVVPSGPLAQLPFQVLVTTPTPNPSPQGGGGQRSDRGVRPVLPEAGTKAGSDHGVRPRGSDTNWLAKHHAITVLPAVSSLQALRRVARPSTATKPMLGIGNPLLDGDPASRPWEAQWAKLARDKQACAPAKTQVAGLTEKRRSVRRVATRGGRADLAHLRSQSPLHDTADELCAVAADLKLAPEDIVLGSRATEAAIKTWSSEGRLAQYRVLHLATHGTIAGEIEGTSEPGLILTPPKEQSELDDGYLSASEVAALKLDADWVILSACNTAAGGAQGAEALSGLARAFIYAGARAMLVSHWAVDSAATVKLITAAVGSITRDARIGRAEALRRAMLSMIAAGGRDAHPALWAPFIVVGEGAAR